MIEITERYALLVELCAEHGIALDNPQIIGTFIGLYGQGGTGGRVGAANLPREYKHITLKNSPARSDQSENYGKLADYVATFERQFQPDGKRIKSLYMWSANPGTGKTTSAVAVLNTFIRDYYIGTVKRGKQPVQRPAYFASVNRLQSLYNGMTRPGSQEIRDQQGDAYRAELTKLHRTPFVVLDDLAVRSYTEPFLADIHEVINERLTNWLPIIYTSNVAMEELAEIFAKVDTVGRTFDRVRDQTVALHFEGLSKRGLR